MNFSETSHVTVISLDVLYRAHSGLHRGNNVWKFHHDYTLSYAFKDATFNLVKHCTSLWKYDYIL